MSHCSSCGNIVGEDCGEWEGYTSCCNKRVCYGDRFGTDRFGTPASNVRACCWGEAHKIFEAKGVAVPEGSSRLP